jgi:hypothetical protein
VIEYSVNGGLSWLVVEAAGIFEGQDDWGDYPWVIPDEQSTNCLIQVRGYLGEVPTQSGTFTIRAVADGDGDGMDDGWERNHFGDLLQDETTNADGDALTDYQEFMAGTDPLVQDSRRISLGLTCTPGSGGRPAASAFAAALLLALLSFGLLLRWRTSRRSCR